MKTIVTGIVAHVDAGKTTLTEALLFDSGATRKLGRVDHGDSFLDTDAMERRRGITIYSKQARLMWNDTQLVLVDTPGHVDFSAEAERALQVMDAAILVISGPDGIQAHTRTLWNLLQRYHVPTFVFANKMDLEGANRQRLLAELNTKLGEGFLDFGAQRDDAFMEAVAACSENAMEEYFDSGEVSDGTITDMVAKRQLFPCYFGSALSNEGVAQLLDGVAAYASQPAWPQEFGAQIYKITHDKKGERLTWLKVTGGALHAKDLLRSGGNAEEHSATALSAADAVNGWHPGADSYIKSAFGATTAQAARKASGPWEEKANQLRLYSGEKFELANTVEAGQLCAVTGLTCTYAGQGLGAQAGAPAPRLLPVISYSVSSESCDSHKLLEALRTLEDEDPSLGVGFDAETGQIRLQLMGAIQLEVLQEALAERFGIDASFSPGAVIYRETITRAFACGGHFEPLRHYAEMRATMEPLPLSSGILCGSLCSEDTLDLNWQRLVVTHFLERDHLGTLTGSPITDVRLTLTNGRAHAKHTNGGDFRQATYRGIRQGLMKAREAGAIKLLEPWYSYRLEVPADCVGRAMADIQRMGGSFEPPVSQGDAAVLTGRVPVAEVRDYALEVSAYTRGTGHFTCIVDGYDACHNQAAVVEATGYDPMADTANPPDSVFCSHGAGYNVPWYEVDDALHTE